MTVARVNHVEGWRHISEDLYAIQKVPQIKGRVCKHPTEYYNLSLVLNSGYTTEEPGKFTKDLTPDPLHQNLWQWNQGTARF